MKVPDVLLSGNHKDIGIWREEQRKVRTVARREDLIKKKKEN
jgi:tRNA (guanine-N1)-methyltransferase